jgi:hypothetical protein
MAKAKVLKKIKIFTTSNKKMLTTQDKINEWIEQENIEVYELSVANGAMYSGKSGSLNFDEVEMFITVLYSKQM